MPDDMPAEEPLEPEDVIAHIGALSELIQLGIDMARRARRAKARGLSHDAIRSAVELSMADGLNSLDKQAILDAVELELAMPETEQEAAARVRSSPRFKAGGRFVLHRWLRGMSEDDIRLAAGLEMDEKSLSDAERLAFSEGMKFGFLACRKIYPRA